MTSRDLDAADRGEPARGRLADELDVPLEDPVQLEEVELLSSLMIQAGSSDDPLEQTEIDRLLGVDDADDLPAR